MNIIFIDTETTGIDSKCNGIVELAAYLYCDDELVSNYNAAVSMRKQQAAGLTVSLGALAVNKLSLRKPRMDAVERDFIQQEEKIVIEEFCDWLLDMRSKVDGPLHFCGQNVAFDIKFIEAAMSRNNLSGLHDIVSYKILDTASLGLFFADVGLLSNNNINVKGSGLQKLALSLGIDVTNRNLHTAAEDAKLCAEVYLKMKAKLKQLTE
jgi:DNA polymerase III epsilon subunit-like protein